MLAPATYRPCPACESTGIRDLAAYAREQWRIGQCGDCGFVFLRNPVAYQALEEEFSWDRTYAAADAERARERGLLKRLAHKVRMIGYRLKGDPQSFYLRHLPPGRILDIGCGDVVRWRAPFVPYGIEISRTLAARADEKMRARGGQCWQGPGAEVIFELPEAHFDSVMMHSYLEHEVRYRDVLRGVFRVLRPGGRAFVRVPNFASLNRRISGARWPGFRYPDHVSYFTPDTLRTAGTEAGFTFRLVNRHKIWLDDNIQAVLEKPVTGSGARRAPDQQRDRRTQAGTA